MKTENSTIDDALTQKCIAHGCPLMGTSSASTNSSNQWTCKYHYAAPAKNWQALTLFINNNFDLYQAYKKLLKLPTTDWEDNRKKWERATLPPEPAEDIYTYRRRVLNYFERKIDV